jgi:hypothetical protein
MTGDKLMKTERKLSPGVIGCGAFLITLVLSVFAIVVLTLIGPALGFMPGGAIRVLSYIGGWGGLVIGVIAYNWAKNSQA